MSRQPAANPTIVVDTSVAAKWFLPEPGSEAAAKLLESLHQEAVSLAAPDLIVYEFANLLWQRQRRGELGRAEALAIMMDFEQLSINFVAADALGASALHIAVDMGCTPSDGAFIALAAGLESYVVTADAKLLALVKDTEFAIHVRPLKETPS